MQILNLLLIMILGMVESAHASSPITVTLNPVGVKRGGLALHLSQEGGKIFCRTKDVPEHEIIVKGFKWSEVPFKNESSLEPGCRKELIWKKYRQCYRFGKVPVVDDLIRNCLNI